MSDSLRELWLRGIAFNAAAPADVLIRLLDEAAGEAGLLMCEGRDLPDAVIDAALRHPVERIRRALARNLRVDPARLAPLASDPSGLVRAYLAGGTRTRLEPRWVRPLTADILVTFLTAQDGGEDGRLSARDIVGELWSSRRVPLSFPRDMAGHAHPALRLYAAFQWQSLTAAQRDVLLDDPDPAVREAAREGSRRLDPEAVEAELPPIGSRYAVYVLSTCALSPAVVERCFAEDVVHPLARNRHTPADALARLARHPDTEIRRLVATRPDLGAAAELRQDPDEDVRMRARLQPSIRTWAEFEAVRKVVDHGPDCTCPITQPATEPSPDWYATCAASEEPVLRRVAASWPGLPAELVGTLAQDDDEEVRIWLACHHPLAPPHLLLDVFVTRPAHRPHLLTLPAFPRTGRAHLIGHPDPEIRALAAADPALTAPPLDDPDDAVRRAAAANPTLTPETLETLLTDPRTAEGAAANPSFPVPRMHALLDHCLNGAATPPTAARG
ncbi:hypothetical protein ACWGE1_22230 [Streptomyces sp. NPDC054932]